MFKPEELYYGLELNADTYLENLQSGALQGSIIVSLYSRTAWTKLEELYYGLELSADAYVENFQSGILQGSIIVSL